MKKIEAIIKPTQLEGLRSVLTGIGIASLTITEVREFDGGKGRTNVYRGHEYTVDFLPKVKLELVVNDSVSESIIAAIVKAARADSSEDGQVFIHEVADAIRIRTHEPRKAVPA